MPVAHLTRSPQSKVPAPAKEPCTHKRQRRGIILAWGNAPGSRAFKDQALKARLNLGAFRLPNLSQQRTPEAQSANGARSTEAGATPQASIFNRSRR